MNARWTSGALFAAALFPVAVDANPVPLGVPYITMTTEDMRISIEGDCAHFQGTYEFVFVYAEDEPDPPREPPPWTITMTFPVPPDATGITTTYDGEEIAWQEGYRTYETTLLMQVAAPPEYSRWPTVEWTFVVPEARLVTVGVTYDQPLLNLEDEQIFLYSLGTGRYVEGWSPPFLDLDIGGKPFLDISITLDYDPQEHRYLRHVEWGDPQFPEQEMVVEVEPGRIHAEARQYWTETDFVVVLQPLHPFLRGDANQDGVVDIADAVRILDYAFLGGELLCRDAADANDDGKIDLTTAVHLLNFLFLGGDAPPPPFAAPDFMPPGLGPDPTTDGLGCMAYLPAGESRPACP